MLFRKKIQPACSYCSYGTRMGEDQILCVKHGVVTATYSCRKFDYDPCKRIPPRAKALDFESFDIEDFAL